MKHGRPVARARRFLYNGIRTGERGFNMANDPVAEILKLSIAERLLAVEEIWDSIAASSEEVPLTEEEIAELERRLEDHKRNPNSGSSWEEVKARISKSL